MPVKSDTREYRSSMPFKAVEGEEDESYIVEGYATTFDEPYELEGCPGEYEVICKSALDGADMSDVIMQYDHNGMVFARTRNNSLAIMPDDHGLFVRGDLKGSSQGRKAHEAVANGLVDRMSWGFMVDREEGWDYDIETHTTYIRKITKVYDVSMVSIPANQGTEIHKRSAFLDGAIEEAKQELLERNSKRAALALKAKSINL